jgi:predicted transcriptional regulator YdeE
VVTSLKDVPQGLRTFEIPAIKYAVFPIKPKNRFGWPFAIAEAKRYAYTIWLPKSGYQVAGVIDDFEYHDERSTRKKDPMADLYVAIKQGG